MQLLFVNCGQIIIILRPFQVYTFNIPQGQQEDRMTVQRNAKNWYRYDWENWYTGMIGRIGIGMYVGRIIYNLVP